MKRNLTCWLKKDGCLLHISSVADIRSQMHAQWDQEVEKNEIWGETERLNKYFHCCSFFQWKWNIQFGRIIKWRASADGVRHIANQSSEELKMNYQLLLLILGASVALAELQMDFPRPPVSSALLLFPLLSLQESGMDAEHTEQGKQNNYI